MSVIQFPNAKINIGLFITRKREDGYHDLESVFYPVPFLKDALEVLPTASAKTTLKLSGKSVSGSEHDNLVYKAWELLHRDFPERVPPVEIHLLKAIPMGAGMGGGSADGTFMLRLLNDYFSLQLSQAQLAAYALQLGSDCPFFVYNTPQFASGRGEQLTPIDLDLSPYSIQVICPNIHVPTAAAFAGISPKPAPYDLRQLGLLPITEWKEIIANDFEQGIFERYPVLASIKAELYRQGALYASMSGSGSSLYGIFPKGEKARLSSLEIAEQFYQE